MNLASTQTAGPLLEQPDLARRVLGPLISEEWATAPASTWAVNVRRRRRDGRVVAEIVCGPSSRVFAKAYPDAAAGAAAYAVHQRLWTSGFGASSPHRVPEPLAYLSEHGVLVLRPASGKQLTSLPLDARDAVRRTARWLAALHASRVDLDASEDRTRSADRLAREAAIAVACRPDLDRVVGGLLDILAERRQRAPGPGAHVLAHGRFAAEHVYVAPDCVTVVDLDRVALADAAKDVGEFLHRMRWRAGRRRGNVPDAVGGGGAAFVREYLRSSRRDLAALEYHWSFGVVWTLLLLASRGRPSKGWNERSGFLLAELDAIPVRCAELIDGLTPG